MKIAIDKGLLVRTLDKALKAVKPDSITQILKEAVLLEAEDGVLKITSNNNEIGIQSSCECEVIKPGKVVVKADLFSDVIRKLEGEIDITIKDLHMMIEGENSRCRIKGLDANLYPPLPIDLAKEGDVVEVDQKDLKNLIDKTIFAVGTDIARPTLMGEMIKISNGYMEGVAIDGFRMAIRRIKTDAENFEALIPGKTLKDASKILGEGKIKIYKNMSQVLFEADNYLITTRIISGKYINYGDFIQQDTSETVLEIGLKSFKIALESTLPFLSGKPIEISIINNHLKVYCKSEIGESNSLIPAKIDGKDASYLFNPVHILDALKAINDETIILKFKGQMQPLLILPTEGNSFLYFCLPVMTNR